MSSKGIFTALSGSIAQDRRLETIANNIANANTTSFKKDDQVFREYLTAYEKEPSVIRVPKVPASIESFYDHQGGDRSYVDIAGTYSDFSQGALKPTNNPLDIALEGRGFLEVLTPGGVRYTRNGALSVDPRGTLVTKKGYPVLAPGNQEPQRRTIRVGGGQVTISAQGNVLQGGEFRGQLSLVNFDNLDSLKKEGDSLYTIKDNYNPVVSKPSLVVHQGFLENSNVNVVEEMTRMIETTRKFEATQKAIRAYDQMADQLVNSVPRLGGG